MTGDDVQPGRGRGDPGGPDAPPWPLELLAELHAGVFDADVAADLLAQAAADPQARATLDALDATRAALAALPSPAMPGAVAARLAAALRTELTEPDASAGGSPAPRGPSRTGKPA